MAQLSWHETLLLQCAMLIIWSFVYSEQSKFWFQSAVAEAGRFVYTAAYVIAQNCDTNDAVRDSLLLVIFVHLRIHLSRDVLSILVLISSSSGDSFMQAEVSAILDVADHI